MRPSRSTFLQLRGVRHHVREWGTDGAPKLFMFHGWGDASASFQFVADALQAPWHVIAPDWRGFGLSARNAQAYWFPDYLADVDALLDHFCRHEPANLVGHSLGGNVALLYAGIRPARVAKVVAMDAFGLPDRRPEDAPGRYEKWLNQLGRPQGFRSYPDAEAFARRMMRDNPRLDAARATFLAHNLTEPDGEGGVRVAADPAHRNINPILYRRAEAECCWRRVRAPVLWIVQPDPAWRRAMGVDDGMNEAAKACFRDFREVAIAESGHNLHHDQPERTAEVIERFLLS